MIQSGMVADTDVAPNTRLGVGLFNVTKRVSPSDYRPDQRAPKSRKVGVSLRFRF
jgi:hypothetical protein